MIAPPERKVTRYENHAATGRGYAYAGTKIPDCWRRIVCRALVSYSGVFLAAVIIKDRREETFSLRAYKENPAASFYRW